MQWRTTIEGCYVWIDEKDPKLDYSWNGSAISNVANGAGELLVLKNGSVIERESLELKYGALPSDFKKTNNGQSYIGISDEGFISGFAVLIKDNEIYIGNFINSLPEGQLDLYKDGILYYSGSWKSGVISGFGSLYPQNGTELVGKWDNGRLVETIATIESNNGNYSGELKNNKPNGYGIMDYSTGSRYEGEWDDSKWFGEGTYTSNIFKYTGEWNDSYPDGIGLIIFADSSYYEGFWEHGKRNGYGDCLFSDHAFYSGEWNNDLFEGIGTLFYADGSEYDGTWKNGLQNGEGYYKSSTIEYEGEWEEGWANGKGRAEYYNGDVYEGDFVENERYGQGTYFFNNGNVFEGEFVDDTFNGLGIFFFNDGSRYEGEFVDGKICGDGTYYYKDDDGFVAITAVWKGTNAFPETVSMAFPNGDIFEGKILNGVPSADGIWIKGNKSFFSNALAKSSDFYAAHEKTIQNAVTGVATGLLIVSLVTPVGWAGAAANALYVIDVAARTAYNTYNGNYKDAATEVAIDLAFVAVPPMVKKPARKAAVALSSIAKKTGKSVAKRAVIITGKKGFKKSVRITKKEAGVFEKKIVRYSANVSNKTSKPSRKFVSGFLSQRLAKTQIQKDLDAIVSKGNIKLSSKEFKGLIENPKDIRNAIARHTGNKDNFQEFFIRLSMSNKNQVKQLLEKPEIRKYVDNSIRHYNGTGGMHEWLMTSNFEDYLLNPKWGKDGPFLSLSLTKLIQRTNAINFKNGFGHPAAGRPNSSASALWHNELARRIASCSSKEELFLTVKHYAKETLTKESYDEFRRIFWDVFSVAQ